MLQTGCQGNIDPHLRRGFTKQRLGMVDAGHQRLSPGQLWLQLHRFAPDGDRLAIILLAKRINPLKSEGSDVLAILEQGFPVKASHPLGDGIVIGQKNGLRQLCRGVRTAFGNLVKLLKSVLGPLVVIGAQVTPAEHIEHLGILRPLVTPACQGLRYFLWCCITRHQQSCDVHFCARTKSHVKRYGQSRHQQGKGHHQPLVDPCLIAGLPGTGHIVEQFLLQLGTHLLCIVCRDQSLFNLFGQFLFLLPEINDISILVRNQFLS